VGISPKKYNSISIFKSAFLNLPHSIYVPNIAFRIDPLPLPTGPTIAVNFPFVDSKVIFSKVLFSSFSFHFPFTSVSLRFPGPVNF